MVNAPTHIHIIMYVVRSYILSKETDMVVKKSSVYAKDPSKYIMLGLFDGSIGI